MKNKLLDYIERHSKKRDEELVYDFMPSLLEIIERPAHIGGKVIIWGVFGLICFIILWACIAKVEIISTAQGNIQPIEEGEVIYADTTYNVISVHVSQGQRVSEGDLLLELELEDYDKEKENLEKQETELTNQIDVYNQIREEASVDNIDVLSYINSKDIQAIVDEFERYMETRQTYINSGNQKEAEKQKQRYEISVDAWLRDSAEQLEEIQEMQVELEENYENSKVYAPYDAIVEELGVEPAAESVYESQELLKLVSVDTEMRMECYISDVDIADIKEGQDVKIKLSSYPYSEYGTIDGKISFVSDVATPMEGVGSAYMAYVDIADETWQDRMKIGMAGSAELIVGKRRIIEYLLDPVTGALNESMREK